MTKLWPSWQILSFSFRAQHARGKMFTDDVHFAMQETIEFSWEICFQPYPASSPDIIKNFVKMCIILALGGICPPPLQYVRFPGTKNWSGPKGWDFWTFLVFLYCDNLCILLNFSLCYSFVSFVCWVTACLGNQIYIWIHYECFLKKLWHFHDLVKSYAEFGEIVTKCGLR